MYDFDLQGAPDPRNPEVSEKLGYYGVDIVFKLTGYIPDNKCYKLYFGNYFTSIELLIEIKLKNVCAVGASHVRLYIIIRKKIRKKMVEGLIMVQLKKIQW